MNSPIDDLNFAAFILGDIFQSASGISRQEITDFLFERHRYVDNTMQGSLYRVFRQKYHAAWKAYVDEFFKNFLGTWFSFSTPTGAPPEDIFSVITEMLEELQIFLSNGYLIAFQICFFVALYYAIRAVIKSNPKYNLRSIGGLMVMIIIPLMVFGLQNMVQLLPIISLPPVIMMSA